MADYPDSGRIAPSADPMMRPGAPNTASNTTLNMPPARPAPPYLMTVLGVAVVVAIVAVVAWSMMGDDGASVVPGVAPVPQAAAPAASVPDATPSPVPGVAPQGDPAPATPPAGDPPSGTPPVTAPATSP